MNAQSKETREQIQATGGESPSVDDRNPWLGLASFTEETREFFYGREA